MTPAWFLLALLVLNLGACAVFLMRAQLAWALIYFGAALIQTGCIWASR